MPGVEFELTIPLFERIMTFHALDRARYDRPHLTLLERKDRAELSLFSVKHHAMNTYGGVEA
jgi:hypothetical protein